RDHAEAIALAETGIRDADDRGVQDLRVRVQDLLDLPRKELLPAAIDHLLQAADDPQVPRPVELAEVARPEPAVGRAQLGGGGGVLVEAEVDGGTVGGGLALPS